MVYSLVSLVDEYSIRGPADGLAALLILFQGAALILAISFPFGGLAAMVCLQFVIWLERRTVLARNAAAWSLIGTIFALPVAWLFTPNFEGDPRPLSDPIFWLIAACGAIGGFLARFAYCGKLPQISSRNSSSTAR